MEIEEVSGNLQKTFGGKNFKKFLPFIVVGGVAGLFVMLRKSSSDSSDSAVSGSGLNDVGGNLEGVYNDMANQVSESLAQQNAGVYSAIENLANNQAYMDDTYSSVLADITSRLEKAESGNTYAGLMDSINAVEKNSGSIYYDGLSDIEQFNMVKNAVSSSAIPESEKGLTLQEVAGLGNNGIGGTTRDWDNDDSKLKNNPDFVQSEIERTNLVIQNRRKSGLDVTNQLKYQQKLNTIGVEK
jgi:hypothetical protein